MANTIYQVKRTAVSGRTPNTSSPANTQYINAGELALNMADGILYTSNGSNIIVVGSNTINSQVTGTLTVNAISANASIGTAGQVLTSNGTGTYWSSASGGISNVVEDTTPQLGGNLDGQQYTITNVSSLTANAIVLPGLIDIDPPDNTQAFNATVNLTTGNQTFNGMTLAFNVSGTDTATADRVHRGMYISASSSYTGGDLSNEGRLYALEVQADNTGDNDEIASGRFISYNSSIGAGTTDTTTMYGVYGRAWHTRTQPTTTLYGVYGSSLVDDAGALATVNAGTAYGVFGAHIQFTGGISGTTTVGGGGLFLVDCQEGAITTAYAVNAEVDKSTSGIGTGYIYYGRYAGQGTISGTSWGLYVTAEDRNYFSGDVGIGTTSPSAKLDVVGNAEINGNVAITGTTTLNAISANGSVGTAGQVLTSNGSDTYWSTPSEGGGGITTGKAIAMALVFG